MNRSNIELYNVDCVEYMKKCKDNQFDLAIVDPPYGIDGNSHRQNEGRGKLAKSKKYHNALWYQEAPTKEYFEELKRVSKNQIIWGANHFIENIPFANSSSWVVWDKVNGNTSFADCELAYTSFKSAVRKFEFRWSGMLQGDMKNKEIRIHPTQKPVNLYKWLLSKYAEKGDLILDTHLGSGSIAIACDDMGFDLVGCEIDEKYYKDTLKRIKPFMNQQKLF